MAMDSGNSRGGKLDRMMNGRVGRGRDLDD
jgi:hypothetical protein